MFQKEFLIGKNKNFLNPFNAPSSMIYPIAVDSTGFPMSGLLFIHSKDCLSEQVILKKKQ